MPKITFDSDEEFDFDEGITEQPIDTTSHHDSDSDSDDDAAPEAVSITSSRNQAILEAKAQKDAALKLLKTEKEKRRQRDLQLKEQKQGSKREKKQQSVLPKKQQTTSSNNDDEEEEDDDEADNTDDKRLPQDVLEALNDTKDETTSLKRTHLTMADFEAMQADQEAKLEQQLKEQRKKQKKETQGRKVGEYTVKVLNNRPQVAKAGRCLQNMVKGKLNRKSVARQNAVIGGSASRLNGGALIFRRQTVTAKK
ncbi:hypothetical protein BC941DRAFT_414337 [Chlamydoabsidia padenii]|nr:hypothetical protein BC941DRAFT_414337 [Chlamydoabsidia padenii]